MWNLAHNSKHLCCCRWALRRYKCFHARKHEMPKWSSFCRSVRTETNRPAHVCLLFEMSPPATTCMCTHKFSYIQPNRGLKYYENCRFQCNLLHKDQRVVQEHRTQTKAHRLTCERYHQKYFASVCLTDIDKMKYENTRKVCLWHYRFIK